MIAEIIAVGTEIVMGQIANTDAQFLSRELNELGIGVLFHTGVGDNPVRVVDAIQRALSRADLVVTTGGLGPTMDDLTKEMVAECLGLPMELHQPSLDGLEAFFKQRNMQMAENNKRQAWFPQGAEILPNNHGTAPGCMLEQRGKLIVVLPGPPRELEPMFLEEVGPRLVGRSGERIVSRKLRVYGIGESEMENRLRHLIEGQTNPSIAPYIMGNSDLMIRVTARVKDGVDAASLLDPVVKEITSVLGDAVYSACNESMAEVVLRLAREKNKTLAVAESCTGGLIASLLVSEPGASDVFLEGAVTYSNAAKMNRLGVRAETLERYGAVSRETAIEMARGMLRTAGASLAVATTGIAGPGGGTQEKPVGLVFLALARADCDEVEVRELRLRRDREHNRIISAATALNWVRQALLES